MDCLCYTACKMFFQNFVLNPGKGGYYRVYLIQDINAVLAFLYHLLYSPYLALYPLQGHQIVTVIRIPIHNLTSHYKYTIPPYGMSSIKNKARRYSRALFTSTLYLSYVCCLRTFWAFSDFEFNFLAFA